MNIGVIGNPGAWSTDHLVEAAQKRAGAAQALDAAKLRLDLVGQRVTCGGVDLDQFDALIMKKIGQGYAPHHLDRLETLRFLAERGKRIYSHPEKILRMLDRLACTTTLAANGTPVPPTVITEDLEEAVEAVTSFGQAVLKPLYTSKARGMLVAEPGPQLADQLAQFQQDGNPVIYIQKMVESPGSDLGVVFLGGEYLATYARVGKRGVWNTTTNSGGKYEKAEPTADIIEMARRAQEPFGLDFTCVDVVIAKEGVFVFEVSAFGGFRGLHETHGIDVAQLYADYVVGKVEHACSS